MELLTSQKVEEKFIEKGREKATIIKGQIFLYLRKELRKSSLQSRVNCRNWRPGGRYLVYLSDGDVPFFRVSFSPIFSRTGYQKKVNFLGQVVKTCQKRKFCYNGFLFSQIFVSLRILFTDFF